jgi:hypothetical protein
VTTDDTPIGARLSIVATGERLHQGVSTEARFKKRWVRKLILAEAGVLTMNRLPTMQPEEINAPTGDSLDHERVPLS